MSQFLLDRLGRYIKLFVSTVIPFSHVSASVRASQFFIGEKLQKRAQNQSVQLYIIIVNKTAIRRNIRQVAPYDHWCGRCVYNKNVDKTATRLQPVSRHAMATIITGPTFMRKRLCSFIDDFPLDCVALLMISPSLSTQLVPINHCDGKRGN